jgi:hypothetical protein
LERIFKENYLNRGGGVMERRWEGGKMRMHVDGRMENGK